MRLRILAAWKIYRKGKGSSKTKKKTTKGKMKNLAKRKTRRKANMTIPIAVIAPVLANLLPTLDMTMKGDIDGAKKSLLWNWVGIDANNRFQPKILFEKYAPIVLGALIHKFIGGRPLNINASLGRAGVPVIRI